MQSLAFTNAPRIHRSLTAASERRVLTWLALRIPRAITPDHLTLLGFTAQLTAGASYALARRNHHWLLLAAISILINWFGDSLDGTLARVRNQQRPRYGFYVDHVVDILGSTAMMSGLALSGFIHPLIALAMLIAFLILSAESFLATYTLGRFELSQGPFGPTEIRLLLITGTLFLLRSPYAHILGHTWFLFDIGGIIATTSMFTLALILTLRHTTQLFRQEPIA